MPLTFPTLIPNPISHISFFSRNPNFPPLKTPNFPPTKSPITPQILTLPTKSPNLTHFTSFTSLRPFELHKTHQETSTHVIINFDSFLSLVEFLCLVSSAAISIRLAVNSVFWSSQKQGVVAWLGNGGLVWQSLLLWGAVTAGALLRRRQWRRVCTEVSGSGVDLIERIEKLEEDVRSSVSVVRILSRKLERLGIRYRVTRKTIKEPLAETAALAQKNSDATQELTVREDMLERELSEIQMALLSMQEQQQKQLELILAIGKAGNLWDTKRRPIQNQEASRTGNSAEGEKRLTTPETQGLSSKKESSNDKAS